MSESNTFIKSLQVTTSGFSMSVLRMLTGWIFFIAGAGKVFDWSNYVGWAVSRDYFQKIGIPFPEYTLVLVGSIESVCGILLFFGLFTRLAAVPVCLIIFASILIVHKEGAYYYPMLIFAATLVLMQHGAGYFSVDYFMGKKES